MIIRIQPRAHDHAIPSRDELAGALGALIGAGLAARTGSGFHTTRAGNAVKERWSGGMFGWSSVLPELQRRPRADQEYPLTAEEVQRAYDEYVARP